MSYVFTITPNAPHSFPLFIGDHLSGSTETGAERRYTYTEPRIIYTEKKGAVVTPQMLKNVGYILDVAI